MFVKFALSVQKLTNTLHTTPVMSCKSVPNAIMSFRYTVTSSQMMFNSTSYIACWAVMGAQYMAIHASLLH